MRSPLFRFTGAFKSAPHKSVNTSNILGSKYFRHHAAAGVAAPSQARQNFPPSPPGGAARGRRSLNGSITRTVVVVWKRTKHALRRESSPESQRGGILTGGGFTQGFTLTILRLRKKPWSTSESGGSREASFAGSMNADAGSEWSLV